MNLDPLTDFILDAKQRSEGSQGLEPQDCEFLHWEGCYLDEALMLCFVAFLIRLLVLGAALATCQSEWTTLAGFFASRGQDSRQNLASPTTAVQKDHIPKATSPWLTRSLFQAQWIERGIGPDLWGVGASLTELHPMWHTGRLVLLNSVAMWMESSLKMLMVCTRRVAPKTWLSFMAGTMRFVVSVASDPDHVPVIKRSWKL